MIREATEEDMPRILEIEREAISPPWSEGGILGEVYSDHSYFALACDGASTHSAVLGFAILQRNLDEGELLQIAVGTEYRRSGIADELMTATLLWAKSSGIRMIFLEVRESNAPAIMLYEKHGFKKAGLRRGYYIDPKEDAVVMSRV